MNPSASLSSVLEKWTRRLLGPFLLGVWLATVANFPRVLALNAGWVLGDWLISYAGGFVRRGLPGTVVLALARWMGASPSLLVWLTLAGGYGLFLWGAYRALRAQETLWPYAWLIFSPFIFLTQLYDPIGGYRKEVLYYALLFSWIGLGRNGSPAQRRGWFWLAAFAWPLLIFSHEVLLLGWPYWLAAGWLGGVLRSEDRPRILLATAGVGAAFAAAVLTPYGASNLSALTAASGSHYQAFDWLTYSLAFARDETWRIIRLAGYGRTYPLALVLAFLGYLPLTPRFRRWKRTPHVWTLTLASLLLTLPLFAVALDWGRFLTFHLLSWFALSLLTPAPPPRWTASLDSSMIGSVVVLVFSLAYWTLWRIPHCCGAPFLRWMTR